MTTANKVTIGRIILVPIFVVQLLYYFRNPEAHIHWYAAMAIFLVATVSDGIDGYLAKFCGQATQLGSYLDPIADKLLMFSGLILLSIEFESNPFSQRIPLWLTATVIGRDVIIVTGSCLLYVVMGNVEVKPLFLSKTSAVNFITSLYVALEAAFQSSQDLSSVLDKRNRCTDTPSPSHQASSWYQ